MAREKEEAAAKMRLKQAAGMDISHQFYIHPQNKDTNHRFPEQPTLKMKPAEIILISLHQDVKSLERYLTTPASFE